MALFHASPCPSSLQASAGSTLSSRVLATVCDGIEVCQLRRESITPRKWLFAAISRPLHRGPPHSLLPPAASASCPTHAQGLSSDALGLPWHHCTVDGGGPAVPGRTLRTERVAWRGSVRRVLPLRRPTREEPVHHRGLRPSVGHDEAPQTAWPRQQTPGPPPC